MKKFMLENFFDDEETYEQARPFYIAIGVAMIIGTVIQIIFC